jgi:hypothetical protein
VRAADLIEKLNLQRDEIQNAADKLRRQCLVGLMTAIDGKNRPIPAIDWRHLKIVPGGDNVPKVVRRGRPSSEPAYLDVVFSRVEVLREFPPKETHNDVQENAAYVEGLSPEGLGLRRQWRGRAAHWFNRRQERIAIEKRGWLRLTEIADEYARKSGSLTIEEEKWEQFLDELRRSILAGEFLDDQDRSRVLNMHPSSLADFRFDALGARHADLFNPTARHLWITHQDCVDWFNRHGLDLPHRLRSESSSTVLPEAARYERTPAESLRPAKKSLEEKVADALEVAKRFVVNGVAPSVKEHATLVMGVLKRQHPQSHMRREDLEGLLATEFKAQRRPQGNSRSKRSR